MCESSACSSSEENFTTAVEVSIVDVSVLTNQFEDDHNNTHGNRQVLQTIEESSLVEVIVEK